MLQYVCDNCSAVKNPRDEWILGFAADRLGVRAARREVSIAPRWDENRAVQWFAIHLCSIQCREEYLARLFGEVPPGATDVVEATQVAEQPLSVVAKTKRTRKIVRVKRRKAS